MRYTSDVPVRCECCGRMDLRLPSYPDSRSEIPNGMWLSGKPICLDCFKELTEKMYQVVTKVEDTTGDGGVVI